MRGRRAPTTAAAGRCARGAGAAAVSGSRIARLAPAALLALCASACLGPSGPPPPLARARVAGDHQSYRLQRVGLLPFRGELASEHAATLQQAFQLELSGAAPFELVALSERDLAEVAPADAHRRGWYSPRTILDLSRRYHLDGLFVPTVTQADLYAPQVLAVQMDLVASETGLVIWSATLQLDAADARLQRNLEAYRKGQSDLTGENARRTLTLISPAAFARFAAYEVGRVL